MPLSDGTLELNHLDGWQVKSGSAKVAQGLEVPTDGCSAQADRPWRLVRDDVKRAWIDGSFATVVTEPGMTNFDYFLRNMQELGGDMGVPITFLEQHNPDQFEIVSFSEDNLAKEAGIMQDRTGRTKPEVEEDGKCKNVWRASSSATCAPSRARRPSMQIERRKTIVSEVVAGYHNNAYKVMTGQQLLSPSASTSTVRSVWTTSTSAACLTIRCRSFSATSCSSTCTTVPTPRSGAGFALSISRARD